MFLCEVVNVTAGFTWQDVCIYGMLCIVAIVMCKSL